MCTENEHAKNCNLPPKVPLTDHEVELIRQLRSDGWRVVAIAEKMDLPKGTVSKIVNFKTRVG
jgi:DNA-binding NarL/FixJ family response regulator